jgi:hypothetical protein
MEATPKPDGAPETTPAKSELPSVESPPLSPGGEPPAPVADTAKPVTAALAVAAPATPPRLIVKARHKRYALLAATVAFAAELGAVIGALASGGFSAPAPSSAASAEENKAMQQSIARLAKEIAVLKAGLEQANGSAHSQVAKISERLDHAAAEITGSIAAPQTTVPQAMTPLPMPRPAPRATGSEAQAPVRLMVVSGWTIRDARDGYLYVENHGDIYQAALGASLPGLGPVQAIRRQDGRWMVLTPRGVIVAMRDRRYFEDF